MTLYGGFAMNSPRMLCATCGRTDVPDDLVFGSDRLELAAWALLLLPGLLYCLWRHANRRTVCAHCGSDVLLRETRFSRERRVAEGVQDRVGRAVYAAPRVRWLGLPGTRLRRTGGAGALMATALAGWSLFGTNTIEIEPTSTTSPRGAIADPVRHESLSRFNLESECERLCLEFNRTAELAHRECLERCTAPSAIDPLAAATATVPPALSGTWAGHASPR
jgi:hypothetical protein